MSQDFSRREHLHVQKYTFRFQSETRSPRKGGSGKPLFSVEPMVYVSSVGWEIIDPTVKFNRLMIGFRDYVRMKELFGYEHSGLTSDKITTMMENLWNVKEKNWE